MDEILRILPQAWSGEPFTHQGASSTSRRSASGPRLRAPIPVLIGGSAEPAIRRAARLADGLFANAPAEKFVEQVGWVLDECERIGRDPSSFRFIHYSVLLPGRSREEAMARYRDATVGGAVEVLRHGSLGDAAAATTSHAAVRSPR